MTQLQPGLLILHGNRLELLAKAVFAWLRSSPLGPLEEESFLVQSNGMAEWLKMEIAATQGVCAATRVELPARFIWRAYRAVLGRSSVPASSPLEKLPMTWRLMGLLPELSRQPGFEPVAGFLGTGDPARRLQLAERLADLFDQYQVYRSDWLHDWSIGQDQLRGPAGITDHARLVPPDQRWQPALWRAAVECLTPGERSATRPVLHQRFLTALQSEERFTSLPRRVVLFGTTHIPHQTLEAIAALASHCQVLMAVPNPCRFHWADIIDGRELLRATRRRQPLRKDRELGEVPLQDMHAHGHPLLAAWGRQGRDFVRQLDAFDNVQLARERFAVPRVDLFDEGAGVSLLEQVQARIRDLVPLAEHFKTVVPQGEHSIVFHIAHSAQREVEILHDQLLHLLAHPPAGRPLNPRDVVVMVPDIDVFAPAIRSVFGQHARGSARHIPWGIADLCDRGHQPLLVALEWLLRAPQQRFVLSEVRDLLDVPAVAKRFGVEAEDLPTLVAWMEGSGVRWGLHAQQRAGLDLEACGGQNTWSFGLRRMLLGYATGEISDPGLADPAVQTGFDGIEPYAEVAGLSAGLAGPLADLLDVLEAWWGDVTVARSPAQWGVRARALVLDLFAATVDSDRAMLSIVDDALGAWLHACETAEFDAPVDLAVVREAWLEAVDEPGVGRRFKAGGVTFCTLLPMRAIPFEVVCLLGMNDGDYPRRGARSDFDLMALSGLARPGDRSRRDDDRQLMLDALISARRVLYVSWAGRSQRDNQVQPPSVLVSQLRDYLIAGWGEAVVSDRTSEHPLQPFSRKYFELQAANVDGEGLFTYASEWRAAHAQAQEPAGTGPIDAVSQRRSVEAVNARGAALTVVRVANFLRNPVKEFFRHRLQVSFEELESGDTDDESFESAGLDRWQLVDEVLREARTRLEALGSPAAVSPAALKAVIVNQVDRLQRAGRLPMAALGRRVRDELVQTLVPMVSQWQSLREEYPEALEKSPLRFDHPTVQGLRLDDWLVGLRGTLEGAGQAAWIELQAGKIAAKDLRSARPNKLLVAWVRSLASSACGYPVTGILVGTDACIRVTPPEPELARPILHDLLQAMQEGLQGREPLPTAVLTGLGFLEDSETARKAYEGSEFGGSGEVREPCLARLYPDYATLAADPRHGPCSRLLYEPFNDWLAKHVTVEALQVAAAGEGSGDE
jgi:exodeoxyribonuclease V gamma subunit